MTATHLPDVPMITALLALIREVVALVKEVLK